ncbi:acyl-CoA-binding protein [Chondrus crispus]|uniref:Acyl-CoA-binding protein n=1 Tax=Chondrus crispus TaxID=2769 RepID=R7QCF6_CHOCR|nr:acyl-CoA-binding protein [Chondrus crispus]CDF35145.1 acyl-CoA-binding protein [Chondrus crispus]|eukprot:XP_005714964.1 acyl-CoA-binding protein [Chondrus crispus]
MPDVNHPRPFRSTSLYKDPPTSSANFSLPSPPPHTPPSTATMGLKDIFSDAAERVKQLPEASNDDKLELYSLFKQSNVGDCATDRPGGLFNMSEKAKWDAYNGKKGMAQDDAMKAYIEKVDSLCGTSFGSQA